jgi:hypothetical protein
MKSYFLVVGVVLLAGRAWAQTIELKPDAAGAQVALSMTNGQTSSKRAVYTFAVTNAGEYAVVAEVRAAGGAGGAVGVNVDAEPVEPEMVWEIRASTNFVSEIVTWRGRGQGNVGLATGLTPKYFALGVGRHELVLKGGAGAVELRSLAVVERPAAPAAPSGLHVVGASPASP